MTGHWSAADASICSADASDSAVPASWEADRVEGGREGERRGTEGREGGRGMGKGKKGEKV